MLLIRRFAAAAYFLILASAACALSISDFSVDDENCAEIAFCGKFKVINVEMPAAKNGWKLEMPLDLGGYKNVFFTSKNKEEEVKNCFRGSCVLKSKPCSPKYEVLSARKVGENSVLANVSFDGEFTAVFFVKKYKRGDAFSYRLSAPMDFKFIDNKYRAGFRSFIIKKVKNLL